MQDRNDVEGGGKRACHIPVMVGETQKFLVRPSSRLIVDANEGWRPDALEPLLAACARARVELVEQPLPVDHDDILARIDHAVPICADESLHIRADLAALKPRYDAVNIKLDKTGGLTEAQALAAEARAQGFSIMVGCMVSTSLAMAQPCRILISSACCCDVLKP